MNLKSSNLKIPLINFDELKEIEELRVGGQASVSKYKWKGALYVVKSYNLHDNESNIVREIARLAQTRVSSKYYSNYEDLPVSKKLPL